MQSQLREKSVCELELEAWSAEVSEGNCLMCCTERKSTSLCSEVNDLETLFAVIGGSGENVCCSKQE